MRKLNDAQKWLKRLERKFPLTKKQKEVIESERKRIREAGFISHEKLHTPLVTIKDRR